MTPTQLFLQPALPEWPWLKGLDQRALPLPVLYAGAPLSVYSPLLSQRNSYEKQWAGVWAVACAAWEFLSAVPWLCSAAFPSLGNRGKDCEGWWLARP